MDHFSDNLLHIDLANAGLCLKPAPRFGGAAPTEVAKLGTHRVALRARAGTGWSSRSSALSRACNVSTRGLVKAPRAKWETHDRDKPAATAMRPYWPRRALVRRRNARTCAEKCCMLPSVGYAKECIACEGYEDDSASSSGTKLRSRRATLLRCMDVMTTHATQLRTISLNIRHLMREREMSVSTLARRADLSKRSVSNALAGYPDSSPNIDTLQRLATAFGIPAWCLLLDLTGCPRGVENELATLIQTYIRLGDAARHRIAVLAEVEARMS